MQNIYTAENEGAEKAVVRRLAQVGTDTGTTTSSFVDAGTVVDTVDKELIAITIGNTGGSNGLSWKILGSIDGVTYAEVVASANVAAGAAGTGYAAQAFYRYYKVQVKDQSGGSHTTYSASYITK